VLRGYGYQLTKDLLTPIVVFAIAAAAAAKRKKNPLFKLQDCVEF
jgi:hypothetical protein